MKGSVSVKSKIVWFIAVAVVAAGVVAYLLSARTPFEKVPPVVGDIAPEIGLADVHGAMVDLSAFKDQVVVVFFWASWCGPCKDQLELFEKIYREHADRGFAVIAIATDDVSRETTAKMGLTFPVARANDRVTAAYGHISSVPATFVIGKDRIILSKHKTYYDEKSLRSEIDAALRANMN
ncbi:MAG: TlpA family protein disulfide reductase [Nitrospirae bacterium]|nr:TlpA family protein disulfide reductase [Nitrospirota bacterium]